MERHKGGGRIKTTRGWRVFAADDFTNAIRAAGVLSWAGAGFLVYISGCLWIDSMIKDSNVHPPYNVFPETPSRTLPEICHYRYPNLLIGVCIPILS